ncbi:MAG: response regulator [Acidobacteriota bacterium]
MLGIAKVRTVLIDDHPLFRQGLAASLRRDPEIDIIGEAGTAEEAVELARQTSIDIAILDVLMPSASGLTIAHELVDLQPDCRILALSVIDEPGLIADMLRAGAGGYVLKTQPVDAIVDAIHQVVGGVRYLPPTVSRDAVDAALATGLPAPLARLTKREREIFELLIRGYSNGEIATKLFIALRTVETHRQRITRKLSARSVFELQRIAARYGGLVA